MMRCMLLRRILIACVVSTAIVAGTPQHSHGEGFAALSVPSGGGVVFGVWAGGQITDIDRSARMAGCLLTSAWVMIDGRFVSFHPQAPSFLNRPFYDQFPGELIPPQTPMLVRCGPSSPGGVAPAPAAAPEAPAPNPPPSDPMPVQPGMYTIENIDGKASLFGQDGQYLGLISTDQSHPDSVCNPNGIHGSIYSPVSVRNRTGSYGSDYHWYSPYNPTTLNPPVIVIDWLGIGLLTKNVALPGALDPDLLFAVYDCAHGERTQSGAAPAGAPVSPLGMGTD